MAKKISPIRPTDAEAIRLAKTLIRSARFGALAVLDPATATPAVTRVATATDSDGTPVLLISTLSQHTKALQQDNRCSLLLGEPGKGDPLAHPRISLACRAIPVPPDSAVHRRVSERYLRRNPKAQLYAGFTDFSHYRLELANGALNGGFGKAYHLTANDLVASSPAIDDLSKAEESIIRLLNSSHQSDVSDCARRLNGTGGKWRVTGIDVEGMDFAIQDNCARIFLNAPLMRFENRESTVEVFCRGLRHN